jgi:hypothetical protein
MEKWTDDLNEMLTTKKPVELPDELSELLKISLSDIEKCMDSPKYSINMDVWFNYNSERHAECEVCMAGAVMAQTLSDHENMSVDRMGIVEPHQLGPSFDGKLSSINSIREGSLRDAFEELYPEELIYEIFDSNEYEELQDEVLYLHRDYKLHSFDEDDPDSFKRFRTGWNKVIELLEAAGY